MPQKVKIIYDYGGKKERICLYCGRTFISKGNYNRKCKKCIRNEKLSPDEFYMPNIHKNNEFEE